MRHVWLICSGLNAAGKRISFWYFFLFRSALMLRMSSVNLDRQIIRSDSRQFDDHGHMTGLLEDVHRRFDDLVDRGPPGLLVWSYIAERFHLQPLASFRSFETGPDREPINSFQLILAELLESLEFLALLGEFSEFLDQVGKTVRKPPPKSASPLAG